MKKIIKISPNYQYCKIGKDIYKQTDGSWDIVPENDVVGLTIPECSDEVKGNSSALKKERVISNFNSMKKVYWIVGILVVVGLLWAFTAKAEEITCPEGQVIESVLISEGSDEIPAVTHIEYRWRANSNASWTQWSLTDNAPVWVSGSNKQTKVVVDEEAIPAVEAVYEDQCVVDEDYVPPVVEEPVVSTPVKKVESTPHPGGHRRCGTAFTPTCEEWVKTLGQPAVGGIMSPQQQLLSYFHQLLSLLIQLQAK